MVLARGRRIAVDRMRSAQVELRSFRLQKVSDCVSEAIDGVEREWEMMEWRIWLRLTGLTAIGKDRIGVLATVCASSAKYALPASAELSTSGTASTTGPTTCPASVFGHF
jgi:hypothetical protein